MLARLLPMIAMVSAQCTTTAFRDLFAGTLSRLDTSSPSSPVYLPSSDGGTFTINAALPNAVIESSRRFTASDNLELTLRVAASPVVGTISALSVFDVSKSSDELDLELMALRPDHVMLPIWQNGVRVPIATAWNEVPATQGGVTWSIPADAQWEPSPYYAYTLRRKAGSAVWSSSDMHTYVIRWSTSTVSYTVDDQLAITYNRSPITAWPTGGSAGVPIRVGPWVPAGDWSGGPAQWPASGSTSMRIESLTVKTCPGQSLARSARRSHNGTAHDAPASLAATSSSATDALSVSLAALALAIASPLLA